MGAAGEPCHRPLRQSAGVSRALPACGPFRRLWLDRQLQDRRLLSFAQQRQQYHPAVGKFKRIVMGGQSCFVDLAKIAVW